MEGAKANAVVSVPYRLRAWCNRSASIPTVIGHVSPFASSSWEGAAKPWFLSANIFVVQELGVVPLHCDLD